MFNSFTVVFTSLPGRRMWAFSDLVYCNSFLFFFFHFCLLELLFSKERKGKSFYLPKDKGGLCVVGRQRDLVSHTFIAKDVTVTVFLKLLRVSEAFFAFITVWYTITIRTIIWMSSLFSVTMYGYFLQVWISMREESPCLPSHHLVCRSG